MTLPPSNLPIEEIKRNTAIPFGRFSKRKYFFYLQVLILLDIPKSVVASLALSFGIRMIYFNGGRDLQRTVRYFPNRHVLLIHEIRS